jgi:hypothetical protein
VSDWKLEYSKAGNEFRINDEEGSVSDVYEFPADGSGLSTVTIDGDPEDESDEDEVFLVALSTYTGDEFEANTVYALAAMDTQVVMGVDFDVEEEEEDDDGSD